MKPINKALLGVAGTMLVLGGVAVGAGMSMGGRAQVRDQIQDINASQSLVHVGTDGIRVGGENGVYVGPGGISVGGNDVDWVETVDGVSRPAANGLEESPLAAFTRLEVDVDLADVTVETGTDYGVALSWNVERYELRYENKDGRLRIWSESKGNHTGINNLTAQVTVTLPEGCSLKKADLHTALGDILWNADADVDSVEVDTDLGDVVWNGVCQSKDASLETNLGNVEVSNLTARELTADSDLGNVQIDFPVSEGVSYDLSTDMGTVSVNGETYKEETAYTARNEEYSIQAESSMGDVDLDY